MSQPIRRLQDARLILASASPRRLMLLGQIGLTPRVVPSTAEEEIVPHLTPAELVESLSHAKAVEVASREPEADLIIGADTVVVHEGRVLGKPVDRAEALRTLGNLSGRWHQVYTGFTLVMPREGRQLTSHVVTEVRFRSLDRDEIERYVETGEPLDKAGSYGIQERGALLVSEIRGDYSNVVGLPLPALDAAWRSLGWCAL